MVQQAFLNERSDHRVAIVLAVRRSSSIADLLAHHDSEIAAQAALAEKALLARHSGDHRNFLEGTLQDMVSDMTADRHDTPNKDEQLSDIDHVLMPLLRLHRMVALQQPIIEQLERSELDLLTYGVTHADFQEKASQLGHTHLGHTHQSQPALICQVASLWGRSIASWWCGW